MSGVKNYPNASPDDLKAQYVGRLLQDIDGPAAIIDIAVARQNCQLMLDAAEQLGVMFRSHVKSHKVIYGLPVQPSCFPRLAALGKALGKMSITVLVDSLDILPSLSRYHELTGYALGVFSKLDTGNNRAGLSPNSPQLKELLDAIYKIEQESSGAIYLRGFYSHMGRSYGSDTTSEALDYLAMEIEQCEIAALLASKLWTGSERRFIIAVGATPTTTSAQNLTGPKPVSTTEERVKELIQRVQQTYDIELHAGAYVTLDMQQLAAHARPAGNTFSFNNLALTVLAEVASLYFHRETPEALIACGQLCMGREPCRSYHGWGVVTPWLHNKDNPESQTSIEWYDPEGNQTGWIIDRLSQEHGILRWQGPIGKMRKLRIGEKVRIWPNHCCICAAGFSYFLVVDSTREGIEKDRVIDVWLTWRGW
ncbi:pyridoxal phosphate-dependent D-serine deaminase [Emydomyces testavorans]|uniref:Pyridoxal phosphate-dependent D-serine deaminase n=1 Tax=Emydomyces testavorans TaxID=2070801 RepID=A0AAF0DD23_9EURO|nr:pyridoxal phosphate-dependent D-serine deaminase [Emydomyces testavorans]